MYQEWPFFTALISNIDMVLTKSDVVIASRYADLVTDRTLRDCIFERNGSLPSMQFSPSVVRRRSFRAIRCSRVPSAIGFHITIH